MIAEYVVNIVNETYLDKFMFCLVLGLLIHNCVFIERGTVHWDYLHVSGLKVLILEEYTRLYVANILRTWELNKYPCYGWVIDRIICSITL